MTGKRRYVSPAFRGSKREAQVALDRLAVEVDGGVEGGSVGTVGELLDRYVEVFGPSTWARVGYRFLTAQTMRLT